MSEAKSARVLVVDDDDEQVQIVARILAKEGHIVRVADSARSALALLSDEKADLVVSDIDMPEMNGLDLLREIRGRWQSQAVVMMSGLSSTDLAVQAVQQGATDFVSKPFDFERLRSAVTKALSPLSGAIVPLRGEFSRQALVGASPPMVRLKQLIQQVAASDCRVLIEGENGTGKELIANAVHAASSRSRTPFVKVNCGALSSTLLESELFGHEKGAFTGASNRRRGRFELADRGTLLLDEVAELSLDAQVRLLRVIQEGEFERVGGTQTLSCDVRIIAATNRNLVDMVDRGEFREDVYYRLNVVTLRAPPLRERRGDIPLLVEHLLNNLDPLRRIKIPEETMALLVERPYPGNVRELQNLIERLSVLLPGLEVSPRLYHELASPPRTPGDRSGGLQQSRIYQPGVNYRDRMLQLEQQLIQDALDSHSGSKSSAAQSLGTDKSFFYRKCRQFGIE